MRRLPRLAAILLALAFGVTVGACSYWVRNPDALKGPVPDHRPVQIWVGSQAYDLHSVVVRGDSVHGNTNWSDFSCDSCTLTVPVASVDSIRTRKANVGVIILLSLAAAGALVYVAAIAALGD